MKTLLFVDDEPQGSQGLQRQLRPMREEWNMAFVDSGRRALEYMAANPVDIIISDMVMPGMDGAQLLSEVLRLHPQTVRVILSGHAERDAVMRLIGPAHQYLAKPCDSDELRQAVARAFALRDLLVNERLKQLTTRIKNLPTLPVLYNRLTEELNRESPSLECAGDIISRDVGLTAKVLQLVNSAFFGLAQPINNPTEAAVYLGLNTLRSVVLTAEIVAQCDQGKNQLFSLDLAAQHSWITAVMARTIAEAEKQEPKIAEQCFLAGLLHDVGQLVLASGLREEYTAVLAQAAAENVPVWQMEERVLNANHADVGAYLLALWGLPNPVIEAVALHHHPAHSSTDGFSAVIAVHAADVFAHQLLKSDSELPPPQLNFTRLAQLGFDSQIDSWQALCCEANLL